MANEHTEFWLALLKLGDSEKERRQLWNVYCFSNCRNVISRFLDTEDEREIRTRLHLPDVSMWEPIKEQLKTFAATREDVPKDPPDTSGQTAAFMDFSGITITDDVSFSGRLLIGANFHGAEFRRTAAFAGTEFIGPAGLAGARFYTDHVPMAETVTRKVSFSKATFHDSASFSSAQFPEQSDFRTTVFRRKASFAEAQFPSRFVRWDLNYSNVSFKLSRFDGAIDFRNTVFGADAEFDNSTMKERADFNGAAFSGTVRFHNCRFRSTTSFRNATFRTPPDFFETELHEDLDFGGVDWNAAERNYHRSATRDELTKDKSNHADHAVRAWARLALIMSQREKPAERHEFFKLKMRAERWRDGKSLLSFLNLLFDMSSDYGWGVGRALGCWAGQVLSMGVVLAVLAMNCSSCAADGWLRCSSLMLHGLLLSFSNSHSFLRLASADGWLSDSRSAIVESSCKTEVFGLIGVTQAILGPILLFLVLLTLRNRFRLK